jgi:hypothetical protein
MLRNQAKPTSTPVDENNSNYQKILKALKSADPLYLHPSKTVDQKPMNSASLLINLEKILDKSNGDDMFHAPKVLLSRTPNSLWRELTASTQQQKRCSNQTSRNDSTQASPVNAQKENNPPVFTANSKS